MKSLLCIAIIVLSAFAPNSTAFVLASRCPLYSTPDFTSSIVQYEETDYFLSQNDQVEVLSTEGDFVLVKTSENVEGYVYKYYLTQNTSQETYPVFNCSVRENCLVYDLKKILQLMLLKKINECLYTTVLTMSKAVIPKFNSF